MTIDYGSGYSSSFRLMKVDPATWADMGEVARVTSASVERDRSGDLIESGSFSVSSDMPESEFWGRVEMLAESGGEVERHAIATLLFSPGKSTARASGADDEFEGRSVLAPAEDRVLLVGTYAPMGADGADYAANLIAECTPAPVEVKGSFTIGEHVVFAMGTTYLEAAWMVLRSAGWCIRITGRGEVVVGPMPDSPSLVLDKANARLLGRQVEIDGAYQDVPNRYVAVDGGQSAVAVDESDAPTSYKSRGRYVDVYDESPQRVNGESLQAYAERRLAEETAVIGKRSYEREWWPDVVPYDIVRGAIARAGLDCDMRVLSQSLQIGKGVLVSETAEVLR